MRDAFATALLALAGEYPNLAVLDGDCSHSTRTYQFQERYPNRFINAGIAEQNMVSMAAGMEKAGLLPIVCGFAAIMVHRAAEQLVQSVAYTTSNVKVIGHYAGVSAAFEGAPHHSIADLALIRSIPNMTVLCPVDDGDVEACLREALSTDGPVYLRLARNPVTARSASEPWRRADGYWLCGEGDVAIVAIGAMSPVALQTAARLRRDGISARVFAVRRLKPLPRAFVNELTSGRYATIATIEDHNVVGGLGGAIAEATSTHAGRVVRFGIADTFTQSGTYDDLLAGLGLTADQISRAISRALEAHVTKEAI
ncbi:1-deoxy-D-xylulose-5-phosphate synthase (plasmid) [Burkholderia sp. AD24]|nr:1-deoxy-D-xylulose-5-phosphate synthase [Burkholderia sp. AD24]